MSYSLQDFIAGYDPTGSANISAAQILALINSGTPYSDKGLLLVTTDVGGVPSVPDGLSNPKLQKYMWVRVQANTVTGYLWNANGQTADVYYKWIPLSAALPDGVITTSKLAPQAVTDDKVASVSWNKLLNIPNNLLTTGAAIAGDVSGTLAASVIGPKAVTDSKLSFDAAVDANRAVGADHIKNKVVSVTRHLAVPGQALVVPLGAADVSAYTEFPLPLLQFLATTIGVANTTAVMAINADPLITDGTSVGTITITPKSTTSLIKVQFTSTFVGSVSTAIAQGVAAIFFGNTPKAAKYVTVSFNNASPPQTVMTLEAIFVSGTTGATNVSVRVGTTNVATTLYVNQASGGGNVFGGTINKGILTVQEIQGTLS